MRRWIITASGIGLVLAIAASYIYRENIIASLFVPTETRIPATQNVTTLEVVARDLATPWAIAFLPSGDMLVTQREGKLTRIGGDGRTIQISGVRETSEGGLLGVAIDPDFAHNAWIYLYYTTAETGSLTNRIDRYKLADREVTDQTKIIANIPAASNHNGGAIAFGPDGNLYVTTGDAAQADLAQDTHSLAGKILRLNSDGSIPADNPYANAVWSYGHRNPQGIAWDASGHLWAVEHGPSGSDSGKDELNRVEKGANYGWPIITGDETRDGMKSPVVQSGSDDTWAPSGMAYHDGALYFAGLRGQTLYKATIDQSGNGVQLERMFTREYGRLRAVTAHDGKIYFSTSNRDGRGAPSGDDDRILRMIGVNR